MPNYISDNSQPRNTFVGLFDILGFKRLRDAKSTAELYRLFDRSFLSLIQHSAAGRGKLETQNGENLWVPDVNISSVAYQIFSDTVILFTPDDTIDSFINIIR